MLNAFLVKEIEKRLQPYVERLRLWHLLLMLLVTVMLSMIYLRPGGVPVAVQEYAKSIGHTPQAFLPSKTIPLSEEQRETLWAQINRLSSQLRDVYVNRMGNQYMNAWAVSQVGLALNDKEILSSSTYRDAILRTQDPETHAWKEFTNSVVHIPATCWSLVALRKTNFSAAHTLAYLISTQRKSDGAWSVYQVPDVPENASTYATAWAILALNYWLDDSSLSKNLISEMESSLSRGLNWVLNSHSVQPWIWYDYPQNEGEGTPSVAVSSLILHVLDTIRDGRDRFDIGVLAAKYLEHRPSVTYTPWSKEVPGVVLFGTDPQEGYKDTVRYYVLPWLVVGTVDSYKYASFRERIRSQVFVEKLLTSLETFAGQMSAEKRPWIAAEYLISLRYLAGEEIL